MQQQILKGPEPNFEPTINFQLFNEVARKGIPKMNPASREYQEWWMEEKRRCTEGYTVGGRYMPGYQYGYINFGTIELYNEKKGRKEKGKPLLRDVEWEVFKHIDRAQREKKGFFWITGRRGGKSFICSWCAASEYTFYPDNEVVVGGFMHDYTDPHMQKVKDHLDGLIETEFYHKRVRDKVDEEFRSGYDVLVGDKWIRKGFNSRIHNIVFKQSHTAANGKTPKLFIFEEVGMFDNLEKAYQSAEPCWKEGSTWFGTPLLIGTGGDMDRGSISAQKMFYDPDTYNFLTFQDDEKDPPQAYFIPAQYVLNDHKKVIPLEEGGDGITLMTNFETADEALERDRVRKKKSKDPSAIIKEIQYYPKNPSEAFMQSVGNKFPQALIQNQINKIIAGKADKIGQIGKLEYEQGVLKWKPDADAREADFPTNKENREGCIVVYEHPEYDSPNMLYIAGTDPYMFDDADSSDSLGATTIYKRFWTPNKTYDLPVATYYGRPESSNKYYENLAKLLEYYKCMDMHENMVVGVKTWFEQNQKLRWLAPQPQIINHIIENSVVDRKYGIHMNVQIRMYAEMKLAEWLAEEYAPGHHNVEKIYSLTLLKELLAYNPKGNFDRVDSMLLVMLYKEELHNVIVDTKDEITMPDDGLFKAWDDKLLKSKPPTPEIGGNSEILVYRSSFENR